MDIETTRLLKIGLPLYTALATALLVLTIAAILYLGRDIFVPIALAVLLSFVLAPGVRGLQRLGLRQGLAVLLTVVTAFGVIAGLASLAGNQLAGLGAELPRYQGTIREKIDALGASASPGGAFSRALSAIGEIGSELQKLGASSDGDISGAQTTKPLPVVIQENNRLIGTLGTFVSPLLHQLATTLLVLIFVVFVLGAREDIRNRFIRLLGTEDIQHTTAVIDDAGGRLSGLFLMQLALNSAFGVVVAVGLGVIGIPSPVLWGILAGMLRFVPYLGTIAGLLPPTLLAIAVESGWSMLLWTVLLFAAVEILFAYVLEPLLFGHSTGLAPVAVVLATATWTFLWGPIGLILATPLTVCLVVLGRHVDGLGFLDIMLGDRPALSAPQIFYQRMLAGDPSEAFLHAKEFLREHALATYYDEVALEALRLAHLDVARARLSADRLAVLIQSTETLISRMETVADPRPKGGAVGTEAAAALTGPDRGAAVEMLGPEDLSPSWRGRMPVVCFARPGSLDEVVARMLSQVLRKHGIGAVVLSPEPDSDSEQAVVTTGDVRMICLSYVEPLSTLHLRHAVRVTRKRFPGSRVVLGIWRERDAVMGQILSKSARADALAQTIGDTLSIVVQAAKIKELGTIQRELVTTRGLQVQSAAAVAE